MKRIFQTVIKKLKIKTSFTVFLLFFGIATLEAFRTRNWLKVVFWVAIATMFLIADNLKGQNQTQQQEAS